MTDRISEIEGRLEAATDGPWKVTDWYRGRSVVTDDSDVYEGPIIEVCRCPDTTTPPRGTDLMADPEFIAHAPSDTRYLLDLVRRQQEVVRRAMEDARGDSTGVAHLCKACGGVMDTPSDHSMDCPIQHIHKEWLRLRRALDTLEED